MRIIRYLYRMNRPIEAHLFINRPWSTESAFANNFLLEHVNGDIVFGSGIIIHFMELKLWKVELICLKSRDEIHLNHIDVGDGNIRQFGENFDSWRPFQDVDHCF